MQYLLDTVTVIRHFADFGRIGKTARKILKSRSVDEDRFIISVISLMEILYLSEKNRIPISLSDTLRVIELSKLYSVVDLNPEILQVAEELKFDELHDRLILATARWLDIPIISSDKSFSEVVGISVIWD